MSYKKEPIDLNNIENPLSINKWVQKQKVDNITECLAKLPLELAEFWLSNYPLPPEPPIVV